MTDRRRFTAIRPCGGWAPQWPRSGHIHVSQSCLVERAQRAL